MTESAVTPVICIVGARPNYMKMAPIMRAFAAHSPAIPTLLVHTGQHYDAAMNDRLFTDLELPRADINLEVGSASHAVQTAEVMKRFEPVIEAHGARAVLVVGDVNSTLACALVAAKRHVPVIHVEAGLRSGDRRMPEEVNRVLTDQISDILYTTERSAHDNLAREGIDPARAVFVGNVMIDTLMANQKKAVAPEALVAQAGLDPQRIRAGFGVVTLHRPSNVDDPAMLRRLIETLHVVSQKLPLVFALHPRTRKNIEAHGLSALLDAPGFLVLPPQGYLEMLGLMASARLVLTDSGGIQEETTALGVPCLTMRESTERPITVTEGTNTIVAGDAKAIIDGVDAILAGGGKGGRIPEGWDGCAAERIAAHLSAWLVEREAQAVAGLPA
ncbi:non-hydrolyzing UDP-N-acetylglucosamine 2-epimerase [Denitromonas ohlonensis]|uniref:UDP-N-acetylglucosamine 2-epimerase (Non-hydrolyzing) n=2 Tax=Denitromonas TaxID=139331 RepID=A0A558EKK8_9RHOO|nr:UDP-N-acetylglucosamine 2-epimerase (non-hydrolyzing) [Denitromonas ohlonensis]TVT48995.1 MAG: UDP-N-acetylglucosamine 2-epimerase (non-hydrolyzing) [Denitromonas halophila]TVO62898.1 UDP-N-acetylglucosamine 2-epimerase (non-hydrolyzing) [Denitromonas ohlonensis]TVO74985.1 UDP-N-acetylglucosamine 2-epimerase (non-hydrolyzing) [Denitromonas ohlonensis]TVT73449.1 MAG: UDP-N-acetylglucosamine 2-epimerase (non-hydrolyzing) [Denitromonas halophila]TVT76023.1 MAG: UDP-N-acetylglucosamine 2-epimer